MQQHQLSFLRPYFVYFSVCTANMLAFVAGATSYWSATIAPILISNDSSINPLPEPATTLESSWIVANVVCGGILGPFAGGVLATKLGKKKAILLLAVPAFTGHLIIAFAARIWMFLVARFIMGLTLGSAFGIIPSYTGDIAEDKNRGLLGSLFVVFVSFGGLCVYVIGPYLSIKLFSLLNLIPFVLLYTLFGLVVPDTPYDLLQKNLVEEAKKSLAFYRGKNVDEVDMEFKKLLDIVKGRNENKNVKIAELIKSIYKDESLFRGVKIVSTTVFFQASSGIAAFGSYYQTIFDESSGSLKSTYSVMIIGVVTLFATTVASQLIERVGRKLLLLTGFFFMAISLFSLGTYFLLKTQGHNTEPISWLPLVSLMMYTIAYNIQGGIPWVLLTDIFPSNVIDICATMSSVTLFLIGFFLTLAFPYLTDALGNYGTFYLFGSCMICAVIFGVLCVPETKGRSVEEVREILRKK